MSAKMEAAKDSIRYRMRIAFDPARPSVVDMIQAMTTAEQTQGLSMHQTQVLFKICATEIDTGLRGLLAAGNPWDMTGFLESLQSRRGVLTYLPPEIFTMTLRALPSAPATTLHGPRQVVAVANTATVLPHARFSAAFIEGFAALSKPLQRETRKMAQDFGSQATRDLLAGRPAAPQP